jgi:signal transduction histidine kinase
MVGINDIAKSHAALSNRALARLLHAEVQNALLARSIALRSLSVESVDPSLLTQIVQDHRTAMTAYLNRLVAPEASTNEPASFEDFIVEITASWRGVASITCDANSSAAEDAELDSILQDVIAEAVTNGVKHGMARRIDISVATDAQSLLLTVDDDGLGPRGGSHGLGSFLYASVPNSEWSLVRSLDLGGATLSLKISRQP